jgi:hypothetical protein
MKLSAIVGFLVCAVLVLCGVVGWMAWSHTKLMRQVDYLEGSSRDADSKVAAAAQQMQMVSSTCGQFLKFVEEDRAEYKRMTEVLLSYSEKNALRAMKGPVPKADPVEQ